MSGGVATSASLSANSNLLEGTGSVGFATTASLLAVSSSQQQISSSYIALSASYNTFSGSASTRVTQIESTYATTGSNSFRANQSITGSLVVSSTITAQTLVVQTVTSSIVYSSGSNIFGSALGDIQTFTGSIYQTGSISAFAGSVGIGTTNPKLGLHVNSGASSSPATTGTTPNGIILFQPNDGANAIVMGAYGTSPYGNWIQSQSTTGLGTTFPLILQPTGGDVGIGITADNPIGNGGTYRNLLVGNGAGYAVFQGVSTATATDSTIVAFSGGTTGASANKNGGSINLQLDATSTGRAIGRWVFYTNSATAFEERMRITSVGLVGIGTTNPTAMLDVYHPTNGYASVGLQGYSGGTKWYLTSGISGDTIQDFSISNNNTGTSPKLRISSTGAATFSSTIQSNDTYGFAVGSISGYRRIEYGTSAATSFAFLTNANGYAGIYANAAIFSSTVTANTSITVNNSGAQAPVLSVISGYADGYRATVRLNNTHTGGKQWELYSTNTADGLYGAGKFAIQNATDSITAMSITSGGVVTKPNQMFVMGGMSSDQSISNSNPTTLNFVANGSYSWYNQNVGSCWNNSTYTLTAPATGIYVVNASVYTSAYGINQIALYVNGSRKNSIPTGYGAAIAGGSAMVILQAGDTLNLRVFNDVGTITLYGNAYHSWFNIYFLG
jgi:hypothetical protein